MFAGEADDLDGVFEGAGEGLVDEDGFFRGESLAELFEVGAAVDAFDQNSVNVGREFRDRGVDFDTVFFDEILGVAIDAGGARFDIGAAAFEGCDDFPAGNVVGGGGVVEGFGKCDDVRGIEADDTEAERGRIGGAQGEEREEDGGEEEAHGIEGLGSGGGARRGGRQRHCRCRGWRQDGGGGSRRGMRS